MLSTLSHSGVEDTFFLLIVLDVSLDLSMQKNEAIPHSEWNLKYCIHCGRLYDGRNIVFEKHSIRTIFLGRFH